MFKVYVISYKNIDNHISNKCSGCIKSIFPECGNNTFGEGCTGVCGLCSENEQCHHINGTCLNSCAPGFRGLKCDQGYTSHQQWHIFEITDSMR